MPPYRAVAANYAGASCLALGAVDAVRGERAGRRADARSPGAAGTLAGRRGAGRWADAPPPRGVVPLRGDGLVCSVCSAALACDARVLCACACWMRVRVCVCCARAAGVCCVLCSVVRPVCAAGRRGLAGRAARRAAACCGWSRACLMVCGGRSARPTGSSAAQGAGMRSALHVRLCARLARMFPCGGGRAYVFTLRARAGAEGGAVSPRSDARWSSA